jgi:hypothetical protein
MVLGQMIRFNSGGISHGQGLASGLNPEDIRQVEARTKKVMQRAGKIPMKSSAQAVMNAAKLASFMENQNELINQQIDHQSRQISAALNNREAAIKFAGTKMKAEQTWQQQGAKLQEMMLQHRLATGVIQSESVGTQQAYAKQSVFDSL